MFRYTDDLHNLVSRYHNALDSLDDMMTIILAEQINAVRNNIYIGCKRINWTSLGMVITEIEMSDVV